jgi:hypothetical protein
LFEQSFKTSLPIIATKARAKICQLLIESQVVTVTGQTHAEKIMPEKFNAGGYGFVSNSMLFNSIKKFALPALRLFIRYSLNHEPPTLIKYYAGRRK